MSTVVNGNIWTGACVNGNVVSGLVKNGAVFYKKQLIDLYKRRVMVGDNLRNKVVYGDFKMGYYVTLMNADEEDSITCNNNRLDTVYEYITSDYCSVDNNMRDSSSNLSLYEYDATNGTEILNNNSLIKNDKDYIVSEIIDNTTYRHLFIKDPNIRPIQVGDKLVSGTKLYFNLPDDILDSYTPQNEDDWISDVCGFSGDNFNMVMNANMSSSGTINRFIEVNYSFNIFKKKDNNIETNLPTYTMSQNVTVTDVYNTIPSNLFLVDTTTLGA